MLSISGGLVRHISNPKENIYAPIVKVEYFDTPLSVPSWGFKNIFYESNLTAPDIFSKNNIVFSGRDASIAHSWGETNPAPVRGGVSFQAQWLGYFYAEYTGTYKFFVSCDDGGRFHIATGANRTVLLPSGLGTNERLFLSPLISGMTNDSWSQKSDIVTYSGWISLTEDTWYPIRADYFNDAGSAQPNADFVVRYQEPSGVTNSSGKTSDTGERKVLSAGVVNYPFGEETWSDASEAKFIGSSTTRHYVELSDISDFSGDRAVGSTAQYTFKIPLDGKTYIPVKDKKSHILHRESGVVIRPGRLVKMHAGFQTKCRYYHQGEERSVGQTLDSTESTHGGSESTGLWYHQRINADAAVMDNMEQGKSIAISANRDLHIIFPSGLGSTIESDILYGIKRKQSTTWEFEVAETGWSSSGDTYTNPDGMGLVTYNNQPHIIYYENNAVITAQRGMRYLWRSSTGVWTNDLIDNSSVVFEPEQGDSAVTIDSSGNIHAVYVKAVSGPNCELRYITGSAGGTLTASTIDTKSGSTGVHSASIAVDSSGNLHVACIDLSASPDTLLYYKYDGSWSSGEIVHTFAGNHTYTVFTSIQVDKNGLVHIAFQDGADDAISYVNGNAGSWNEVESATSDIIFDTADGGSFRLLVDDFTVPHIVFRKTTAATTDRHLAYATRKSGSWVTEWADGNFNTGYALGATIDFNGHMHVIHGDRVGTSSTDGNIVYSTNAPECGQRVATIDNGGFFGKNFCSKVNSICPWAAPMPGDFMQRITGKIVGVDISRTRSENFAIITVQDNTWYLNKALNHNYPNNSSYAMFDYDGKPFTIVEPDGILKPNAYDGFKLSEMIMDLSVKAGIDPSYLYAKQKLLISGGDNEVQYTDGPRLLQGKNIRLSRNARYGNSLYSGADSDLEADDKYLWSQDFAAPLVDHALAASENYGYLFNIDELGNVVFKARNSPTYFPASGLQKPSGWHYLPDTRALAGAYIFASGVAGHTEQTKLTARGNRFDIYFATEREATANSWNLLYNEGLLVSGIEHGTYTNDEVEIPYGIAGRLFEVRGDTVQNIDFSYGTEPFMNMLHASESYIIVRPLYNIDVDMLRVRTLGYNASPFIVWENNAYTSNMKCDITFGQFSITEHSSSSFSKDHGNITINSPTTVASDYNIDKFFNYNGVFTEHTIPITQVTLASGVEYVFKFKSKLFINGVHLTQAAHINYIETDPQYREYCKTGFPWQYIAYPGGVTIDANAIPDPVDWRFLNQFGRQNNGDITWNSSSEDFDINYLINQRRQFCDFSVMNADGVEANSLGFQIFDAQDNEVYSGTHANNFRLPYARLDYRFSTDGVDPYVGYNPNIFTINANQFIDRIPNTHLRPTGNTYTIYISGIHARIEGIAVSTDDIQDEKFMFNTTEHLETLEANYDVEDIRNDVIVVGRLLGAIEDQNTSSIVNPNNPTLDYIYSRAIDVGSISLWDSENSLGINVPFLIFEDNIKDQEHANYLAFASLDRYRKIQNTMSWSSLPVPYLQIEDGLSVSDQSLFTVLANSKQWISGYSENIANGVYNYTVDSTPLAPWPSYQPKPPPDIDDYQNENGVPNIIVGVAMTDTLGNSRNDGAGGTNYDPYESEGGSTNSDSATGYPPVKLKCNFTMLVNGDLRVAVKTYSPDNDQQNNDEIVQWIVGGEAEDTTAIYERFDWGTYDILWEGLDTLGNSRTALQATAEGIRTDLAGIYARDSRYYLHFEVNSTVDADHTVKGAPHIYVTKDLSNNLNPRNTDLGENLPAHNGGTYRKAQMWELQIGAVTSVTINTGNTVGTGVVSQMLAPFSSTEEYFIVGSQSDAGVQVYLSNAGSAWMGNRNVKYNVRIQEGSSTIIPYEELMQYDDGGGNDHYRTMTGTYEVDTPGQWAKNTVLHGASIAADSGISGGADGTNDEFFCTLPICTENKCWGDIPGVPSLDRTDQYVKLNEVETRVNFNPLKYGMRWDEIHNDPTGSWFEAMYPQLKTRFQHVNGTNVLVGMKICQLVYIARWFNFYFECWDRSGRPCTTSQAFTQRNGEGLIPASENTAFTGWIAKRVHWAPNAKGDVVNQNSPIFGNGTDPISWTHASDYNNNTIKRLTIPGYQGQGVLDSELPTGSTIETHTIWCMHDVHPSNALNGQYNAATTTVFNSNYAKYAFYAYPAWMFWNITASDNNYSLRSVDPIGTPNTNFFGPPPMENFRG